MPRRSPSKSDEEIFQGALRAIGRYGVKFTLANVAREVGLTPARMVQRFGSKRGLLHAVAKHWARIGSDEEPRLKEASSALGYLFNEIARSSRSAGHPREFGNRMSVFRFHLDDPVLRRLDTAAYKRQLRRLTGILDRAVELHELRPCDTAQLARIVVEVMTGSYFLWVGYERGSLRAMIQRDVESVLEPYRIPT